MVKREELGAAIVGAAIGVAITYASVAWSDWFASSRYSNAASNLLGIVGGPLLIASIAMGGWRWWNTRCAVRSCLRTGEHPVTDCTVKVCSRHHTRDQHIAVATLHHVEGFLGWGESHHTPPRETRRG